MLEYNIYTSADSDHSLSPDIYSLNSTVASTPPTEGVIISGLYLVCYMLLLWNCINYLQMGAKWNDVKKSLEPTESSDPTLQSIIVSTTMNEISKTKCSTVLTLFA